VRVPEAGVGELAALEHSFNEMAATLEARNRDLAHTHDELRRAVEEARQASAMKSSFLANMSHEIRTPLNGVVGMIDVLGETPLTPEQSDYVSVARASSEALMTVVGDILDLAKIEAGRLDLEHREFDLHELVEGACDMVAAMALSRGLEVQAFVHDDVPRVVCGDGMRVSQILANLLSNAVKFTPQGEVVLEVGLDAQAADPEVRFEVRDTGIGIAPERIEELFEPFTQADAGTTRTYGGTGLGLSIALKLTAMMGGTIDVQSEPGRGSTFTCTLPFAATGSGGDRATATELRGLHVLIVDDNATNRRIFEAYTAAWGMRPAQAHDADSAMAALTRAAKRGDAFDVALLDFHMPERSGLDLAREIRASAQLKRTRIILLTSSGQALPDDPANGIDFALSKPVRQSRLLDAISAVMAEQWAHADDGVLEPAPAEPPVLSGGGQRILVAEDQPVNWMLVQRMLTKRGYRVDNAVNGEQALRMLETEPYDLVFMDCQMPVLDGYQTSREIRKREDAARGTHIPIVAMTAHAMQGDRERCLAAGMDDYLAKPITRLEIDEMLRRWLPSAGVEAEVASTGPGASTPAPADSVLEDSRIRELRTLFPGDELKQVLRELEEDVAAQMQRIDSALRAGDGDEVADAAHRVLNSARMVGAANLVQAAAALEDTAHDREQAPREAAALREHWHAVADALASESAAEHSRSEAEEA
jgi:signal transduction histidine kinase/DNA-binding response OmpR family regulator/HPt (histidine-containing phosphotransfer) domain-containing protein